MASRRAIERAAKRAVMKPAEIDALADKLFEAKKRTYRKTLRELHQRNYGSEIRVTLSAEIESTLRSEADANAGRIARTYHEELARFSSTLTPLPAERLDEAITQWRSVRDRKRAPLIAVSEVYPAHADATLSFFRDVGMEDLTFEFGGHPELGDADPACEICQTLAATNPHPLEDVVAIGTPHPNCRQSWRPQGVDGRELPVDPVLGQTPGGIAGRRSLVTRAGGRAQAVEFIEAQQGR